MSPFGGGPTSAGPFINTFLADLETAWREREEEARELMKLGHGSMALALRVYALEIQIKARICRHLGLDRLPRACKTHDLSELIAFTGLWNELEDPMNVAVRKNWNLLVNFSKIWLNDLRYLPRTVLGPSELTGCVRALDDLHDGVLAWLSKHP